MNFYVQNKKMVKQFSKFVLIGLESTLLTYLTFLFLWNYLNVNYLLASGTGIILGTVFGFFFNKKYTFDSRKKIEKIMAPYFLVYTFSLIVGLLSLRIFVINLEIPILISKVLIISITTFTNFFGTKFIVFKN